MKNPVIVALLAVCALGVGYLAYTHWSDRQKEEAAMRHAVEDEAVRIKYGNYAVAVKGRVEAENAIELLNAKREGRTAHLKNWLNEYNSQRANDDANAAKMRSIFSEPKGSPPAAATSATTLYKGKPSAHWLAQVRDRDSKAKDEAYQALGWFSADEPGVVDMLKRSLADRPYTTPIQKMLIAASIYRIRHNPADFIDPVSKMIHEQADSPGGFLYDKEIIVLINSVGADAEALRPALEYEKSERAIESLDNFRPTK